MKNTPHLGGGVPKSDHPPNARLPGVLRDDLIQLAGTVCDVPVAILVLDGEEIDLPGLPVSEFTTDLVVVTDAVQDPRFGGCPAVGGADGLRFIGIAPLIGSHGDVLGHLCVADRVPRILTPAQEETLRIVARQTVAHLESRREERRPVAGVWKSSAEGDLHGVVFADLTGHITGANEGFLEILGYSHDDLVGGLLTWSQIVSEEPGDLARPFERTLLRKDGSSVSVFAATVPAWDGEFTVIVDLSARNDQQRNYLRAHRVESVRTLARGISHDLNNVFAPILMSLDLLKMRFPDAANQELIGHIETSAQRGVETVKQVTAFARDLQGQRVDVPLRQVLDGLEILHHESMLRDVHIAKFLPSELWPASGDPAQLARIFTNLCENARDAMAGGGRLTISAANLTLDARSAAMHCDAKPRRYVLLQIADTGHGMSPAVLEQVFDPYFTTRQSGKGSGLGLPVVHALVKSHGGFVRAFSDPGQGAIFKIYLPAGEPPAPAPSSFTDAFQRGRGELILVVDDEAPVRMVTRHLLENYGYRVVVAADGAEALEIYAQTQGVAAVVTDIMMPGMDGIELVAQLRANDPHVPVIAASGVSPQPGVFGPHRVDHFLRKPYAAETLLAALDAILPVGRSRAVN